ncbi:MAG: DedA family protein [Candidatus Dormibacteraceae bacterium]
MNDLILHLLDSITRLPVPLLYLVIVVWLIAESAAVPIPNEAILLCAGFLVGVGHLNLPLAWLASIFGTIIGASLAWWLARSLGRVGVERFGRYIFLTPDRLTMAEHFFGRRGALTIFLARLTPVVRTVISYPAGLLNMRYRPFLGATVVGCAIWNLLMLLIGQAVGARWRTLFEQTHNGLLLLGGLVIVALIGYLIVDQLIKRRWGSPTPL